ncbi:MAG TPA: DUF192 domain-containing protein [Spirochaetota bacterium]|nr:DUF192 domain-containing protein [Spirochaetota bacterium]
MNFKSRHILIPALLAVLILPVFSKSGSFTIFILRYKSGKIPISIEIADTQPEKEKGLMFRSSLPYDRGMLFVFDSERSLSFWMKNTYIPLDIAYISSKGIINEIYRMEPLDYSIVYPSKKPAKYALEVNAGWFKKNGIEPGMKLDFNGCLGK